MTSRAPSAVLVLAVVACAACGSDATTQSPTSPSGNVTPTVTAISPATGTTFGGTSITVNGLNFSTGATLTIGGIAATGVVVNSTSITATTPPHAAGAADVVVTQNGLFGLLAGGFTYYTPPPPTVTSIFPAAGTSAGGTAVTLTGTSFTSDLVVMIGGVPATSVVVVSPTSITAVTGAHAVGAVDVVVNVVGQSGTLAKGFTYVAPGQNMLPVINSITVQSSQTSAPSNFADLGESVPVFASVTDAETLVSQLTFAWSADAGTFSGTGPSVTWQAPATASTPRSVALTLRVIEAVGSTTQSVTKTVTLSLHDSKTEIATLSRQFLLDFSNSSLAPSYVVRDFYDGCPGKADELSDVTTNRRDFLITSFTIGTASPVSVAFKAGCVVPERGTRDGDGCAVVQCEWHDKDRVTGTLGTSKGPDYLTAVYRGDRWWLCSSDFPSGTHTSPLTGASFIR
jgi:uncharacterized protein (DUF2237 family)